MFKKVVVTSTLFISLASIASVHAGYQEVECDTDSVFAENSCDQCFDGGARGAGSSVGGIDDIWANNTSSDQLMYQEEQENPYMLNLNTGPVEWVQTPSEEDFWEYTSELEALYDGDYMGYILPAGGSVTWTKSKLGSAYTLERNEAENGENIGLLVFPLKVFPIVDGGEPSLDSKVHKECVLFKSGDAQEGPEAPKQLPKTGPAQFLVLLVLAMILAFGVLRFKKS